MNLPTTPVPSNEFPWVSCKEGYGLLTLEIDVQKVRDLMGSHPFPQGVVAVKDLKGILGLTSLEPRDAEINLKVPLLLVECPGDYGTLLVDGYHRLDKAVKEGLETLPAYLLPVEFFFDVAVSYGKYLAKFKPKKVRKAKTNGSSVK